MAEPLGPRAREIVTVARQLLEQEGAEALTMRRLAERLGIRAPSLYKHLPDKAALEAAIIATGFEDAAAAFEAALDRAGDSGVEALAALATAYRSFAVTHPHLYRLMTDRPLPRDRLPEGVEARAAAPLLRAAGNQDLARAVWAFAHGMVQLELARRFPPGADLDSAWREGVTALQARQATGLRWPAAGRLDEDRQRRRREEEQPMSDEVTAFRIEVPEADVRDLRERLQRTRWPEAETVPDWSQGVPLAYLRELCGYWADGYDWRATEARLNALPQFRTELDGLGIHFVHLRSPHPDALPLVMTHGWPGSVVEFLKVLGPLTDPTAHGGDAADAFHVVCPSLPGYGFSDKPARPGWGVERIAGAWARLMDRLGYGRYGAQGSDWGTSVSTSIGQQDPGHVAGIHLTPPLAPPDPATFDDLTAAERAALASLEHAEWDSGYSQEQATRPQTVGYALVDSPVALCAWIVEKFWSWTDSDGHPENVLTRDELLDNVMLYWLPGTGASAARLYWESIRQVNRWISGSASDTVAVPTGCSVFPRELQRPSRRWAERRFLDIRYWNEPAKGGHFAAFEQPALFVEEVRGFFRLVR